MALSEIHGLGNLLETNKIAIRKCEQDEQVMCGGIMDKNLVADNLSPWSLNGTISDFPHSDQDRDVQSQDGAMYSGNSMVDDLVAKILDDDAFLVGSGPNDCLSGVASQRESDVFSVYNGPSMLGSRWAEQFQNGVNGTSLNLSSVDSLGPIDGLKMPDFGQSHIGIVKDFLSSSSEYPCLNLGSVDHADFDVLNVAALQGHCPGSGSGQSVQTLPPPLPHPQTRPLPPDAYAEQLRLCAQQQPYQSEQQGFSPPSSMVKDFSNDSNFLSGSPLSLYSSGSVPQGSDPHQPDRKSVV